MNNFRFKYLLNFINRISIVLIIIIFIIPILLLFNLKKKRGYSLFIEFSHGYGIKQGTSVSFRGIQIGHIQNIHMKVNSIIVLVYIKSSKILIPKQSIIETNQTGLFNDVTIDIIPINQSRVINLLGTKQNNFNVFSNNCLTSKFLCNYHYLYGGRGLNYDDLMRAATRISQRFDDPRFFSLFYIFLQNNIDLSDDLLYIFKNISYILYIFMNGIEMYFFKYFC
uniref:Putative chloroplast RF22 n=1 Tax=Cumathamnion serrulatum TaxID=1206573 RepID=A0A7U1G3Z7_9FLOR|nr:putative chloroplast RF22 [Cumathamnion serrulatum]QQY85312.1 putative chloroplast RF22 [Cumathamnion serrulatum]